MTRRAMAHGRRVVWVSAAWAAVPTLVAIVLAALPQAGAPLRWALAATAVVGASLGVAATRGAARRPLRALANLLAGLRQGDYTLRSARARGDDDWGVVMLEANALADTLSEQRIGAVEATALLRKVMAEIDVAVFAFDDQGALRLVNRAGERLLGRPREQLEGAAAATLGLAEHLAGASPRTVELAFPGASGRGELRRGAFRQGGRPHTLLVISDLSRALRQQELEAWRRLVRGISHEINNSLTPIASVAASLRSLGARSPRPDDYEDDLRGGLSLIEARADSLRRFMASYARLARLPVPRRQAVDIGELIGRIAALTPGVVVDHGPECTVEADPDQLEQLLINLLANAQDALLEAHAHDGSDRGGVRIAWERAHDDLVIRVVDDGLGLANPANLFVPFFSTKVGGSGIGLALSRQIAESHGGQVTLHNREDARGCEAVVVLPTAV